MLKEYNALFDGLLSGFLILDKEGYVVYANPAVTTITGFDTKKLVNQPVHFLFDNDSIKSDYELEIVRKTGNFISEGWRTRYDGSRYWAEMTFSLIRDENRKHIGYNCMLRDETQKKNWSSMNFEKENSDTG